MRYLIILTVLFALNVQAGPIEKLTLEMERFRSALDASAERGNEAGKLREQLLAAESNKRLPIYEKYLEARLDEIRSNRELLKQLEGLIVEAEGLSDGDALKDGERVSLDKIMSGYHADMKQYVADLEPLRADLEQLAKNAPSDTAEALSEYQEAMTVVIDSLEESVKRFEMPQQNGKTVGLQDLTVPLKIIQTFLSGRQTIEMIDYKMTLASSKMHEFTGKMDKLYDAAFGSARPDATLEQFGRHGIDVSIWIDTMAEMIKGHDMGKFRELHQPARIKAANARVAEYRISTRPYSVDGVRYFYSSTEDRWFWLENGKRLWAPYDWEKQTGRYVRRQDTAWVSAHPDYQLPEIVYPDEELAPSTETTGK
jgi:hypothetical protein